MSRHDIIHDIGSAEDETNEFYHKWLDRKAEVENLSRKLEEARERIGELEALASQQDRRIDELMTAEGLATSRSDLLEAALKPFADEADRWDDSFDDAEPLYDNGFEEPAPLVGDLRNARSKLEGQGE